MAGISFSVFREQILSGAKCQTIRAVRKNPIKVGETLYLWWKQRSPEREKLGEATCTSIKHVFINNGVEIKKADDDFAAFLSGEQLEEFAIADGFNNWQELVEFFESTHGLPFEGIVIQWDSVKSPF